MWHTHGWFDGGNWGGIVMMILMILFWAIVIALIVWLVRGYLAPGTRRPAGPVEQTAMLSPRSEDPLEIVRRRYAAGEIDREEFEQKTKDLSG